MSNSRLGLAETPDIRDLKDFSNNEFAEALYPKVISLALQNGIDQSMLDDVVQESLLKIVQHRHMLRNWSKLRPWIAQIVRNEFRKELRRCARQRKKPYSGQSHPYAVSADERLEYRERIQDWWTRSVGSCATQQKIFFRVLYLGETYPEACVGVNVSVPAAKVRLHRARREFHRQNRGACEFA